MMTARSVKVWFLVHKWTSLVCTAFLFLLCVTGLPLIFHEELEEILDGATVMAELPPDTPRVSLDRLLEDGMAASPGMMPLYMTWAGAPNQALLTVGPGRLIPPTEMSGVIFDQRTAEILKQPKPELDFLTLMLRLHVDLFAGLPGGLFLGFMGLLFAASLISGVVLYAPFMRRLDFGTVRRQRSSRVKWLDLHNLMGIATLLWCLVVGLTGSLHTCAELLIGAWRNSDLAEIAQAYEGQPLPRTYASLEKIVTTAEAALPEMEPRFVAWPGTFFSTPYHFVVGMRGRTPLTSKLIKPVVLDARSGEIDEIRDMPWYLTAVLISEPLHFGDYGGMPMKILWAILDIVAIIVLGSGLYLWLKRGAPSYRKELARQEALPAE